MSLSKIMVLFLPKPMSGCGFLQNLFAYEHHSKKQTLQHLGNILGGLIQ